MTLRPAVEADDVDVDAVAALEVGGREQVAISCSTSTRFERGTITRRVGFSWSDSSRRSSTIGSFFARICAAICSSTFAPETWYGSAVMTMFAVLDLVRARARARVPLPVS